MNSQHLFPVRRRQRGQAVVWFLATIAACCCVFALVYNVGQVANQKEATVNAADAAALSGALVEARMLNFEAYTNRAMIANEVTIAQLHSFDSWVQYDYEIAQWIATETEVIPYLDDVTSAVSEAAMAAHEVVNGVVAVAIPAIEVVNSTLWVAREAANYTGAFAANDVAGQIANANETTFGNRYDEQPQQVSSFAAALVGFNEYNWYSFTAPYSADQGGGGNQGGGNQGGGDPRATAKTAILNSRDPFSTNRGGGTLVDSINFFLGLLTLGPVGLEKTSGTATLQNYDHWAAQDSIDLTLFGGISPFDVPIGYGRADADANGKVGTDLCNIKPTTTNCTLAVKNADNFDWNGTEPNNNGIPNIRDLKQGLANTDPCSTNNGSDSPSLSFITAVQKAGKATETTQRLGMNTVDVAGPQGSPQLSDKLQNNDNLTSISAACTFFLRPDLNAKDKTQGSLARADGVHEYASLYNPYWQARLTKPGAEWTTLLYALIGQPGLNVATP